MSERGQIAARADGSARGHVGDDPCIECGEQQLDGLDAGAGVALRDRVRAQHHCSPHDVVGVRRTDAARVAAEETELELRRLVVRDRLGDEPTETRVDPVRMLATELVEKPARTAHPLDGRRRQRDRLSARSQRARRHRP